MTPNRGHIASGTPSFCATPFGSLNCCVSRSVLTWISDPSNSIVWYRYLNWRGSGIRSHLKEALYPTTYLYRLRPLSGLTIKIPCFTLSPPLNCRALIIDRPRHVDLIALGTPVAPHLEASQASNATASTLYVVPRIRAP